MCWKQQEEGDAKCLEIFFLNFTTTTTIEVVHRVTKEEEEEEKEKEDEKITFPSFMAVWKSCPQQGCQWGNPSQQPDKAILKRDMISFYTFARTS